MVVKAGYDSAHTVRFNQDKVPQKGVITLLISLRILITKWGKSFRGMHLCVTINNWKFKLSGS